MTATATMQSECSWDVLNQGYLVRAFAGLLLRFDEDAPAHVEEPGAPAEEPINPPAAIDTLASIFALTEFERELLLLLAGVEMDSALAARCAQADGRAQNGSPTFSLAMALLENPHWSALAPSAPLRRFHLIEVQRGHGLMTAPLHIDERILHYLAGVNQLDRRLEGMLRNRDIPKQIDEEHLRLAMETIGNLDGDSLPAAVLHLCGDDSAAQESIAALVARRAGFELFILHHEHTPQLGADLEQFLELWMRESLLLPAILLLQWESETPSPAAFQLAERIPAGLMIASRDAIQLRRTVERFEVNRPAPAAQLRMWTELFPELRELAESLSEIAEQFRFSAETIGAIHAQVQAICRESDPEILGMALWKACREQARPRLESHAERIVPRATWDDLVIPPLQMETLRLIASEARHRMTVYETWGFAERGRRGLGLSALFAGPSGTGKTLAAEVLAGELKLDLYRIDLSAVVSKYIGETERNLSQVFDAAETGGVLLLFDEADALFGKRAEVKDSLDRYANIEVSYLLQRMESFQGLAILTTNLKSSLDKAFLRRLRFTVDFPFPDSAQREAIWSRIFPAKTPTHAIDPARLAALNMAGGNIRNIALNATFLAAADGEPVGMAHLLHAAQLEAVKIERPLADAETRGWV